MTATRARAEPTPRDLIDILRARYAEARLTRRGWHCPWCRTACTLPSIVALPACAGCGRMLQSAAAQAPPLRGGEAP